MNYQLTKTNLNIRSKMTQELKDFNIRPTKIRTEIYTVFNQFKHALSHSDIEEKISKNYDRVTIYRTLNTFEEQGVIHKVLDDLGTFRFALCRTEACSEHHQHQDQHIHFTCTFCKHLFCLENIELPPFKIPLGYKIQNLQLKADGICPDCQTK
jgi:Fur family ferric uptake transcriptional regulator